MNIKNNHSLLNIQTNSNLSFSLIKILELVDWGKKSGCEYLAIADYYPYEFLHFYQLCKESKIKPVIGVKVIVKESEKQYLATLYPQNSTGYKDLMKKIFSKDSPENRVFSLEDILFLKKNCLLVFCAHTLQDIHYFSQKPFFLNQTEKTQFYIGFDFHISKADKVIHPSILPLLLPFLATKTFSSDETTIINALKPTSFVKHFLPIDVQQKFISLLSEEKLFSFYTNDKTFYNIICAQTRSFVNKINLKFAFSSGKDSEEPEKFLELQNRCERQLFFLKKVAKEKYQTRLEKELQVINQLNYSRYFLTFNDIINDLREKNIMVGPGRGSAVASLVSYLLKITKIDPLEHNLFFERFLNEKRKTLPDIDIDVENQKKVIEYLQIKYGSEKIARLATKQKFGWKNAFYEVAKITNQNKRKPIVGETELENILSCVKNDVLQENLKTQVLRSKFNSLFKIAEKISQLYSNSSIHASGVIISEKQSLTQLIPLKSDPKMGQNSLISYYSEKTLNLVGLKKYDFLNLVSLENLSEVKNILGKKQLPKCNLRDKDTWKLLNNGLVAGVPQLDTIPFRELISSFQPQNFADLVLILALNRPGARKNAETIWNLKQTQLKKNLNNQAWYANQAFNQVFAETYGSLVFEEQVSQIFSLVFNCSFVEAEVYRRNLATLLSKESLPSKV
jgi:DNA polymerase-3 subunit alpha